MDPGTLAIGSMAAGGAGGIVKAFGDLWGGQASAQAFKYKAGVARLNQQIDQQNANWARAQGETEAQTAGMRGRATIGATLAAQSASNLDVNRGSASEVRSSELAVEQQNEAIIRSSAARKAYGYETEAMSHGIEANIDEVAAEQAKTASYISAAASLLGTTANVSSKWLQYGQYFGTKGEGEHKPAGLPEQA